jgi:LuxR family quorum-sensing transcriptional regulator LasR
MSFENNPLMLVDAVAVSKDEEDFLARTQTVGSAIGWDHVLFGVELRAPYWKPVQHITSGYPSEYQQVYQEKGFIGVDPSVPYCQTHTEPLIWDETMYSAQSFELLEESRKFGLGYGISIPVREMDRVVGMLSLARDRPFESEAEKRMVIASGNVLAHVALVTAKRIIVPAIQRAIQQELHLTSRERECLKHIADGKSNGVIAGILNLSEPTVVFHVANLYRKLGVASRYQAIAVGLSLRLIP